ncbi:MAG TPA: hypothetical protein VNQ76_07340 [Planctomicrobium sp.]|nr:hypothetical protein [Planctomicrobium sp.]
MWDKLRLRAWHIAGHAYSAMAQDCPVHQLTLEGFTQADLDRRGEAQRLDPWTMICLPTVHRPLAPGTYSPISQRVMFIALAGPMVELIWSEQECTLENIQRFKEDWRQVWTAAGGTWFNELARKDFLMKCISNGPIVLRGDLTTEFVWTVSEHLLNHGGMNRDEVQAAWEKTLEMCEKWSRQPARQPVVLDFPDVPDVFGMTRDWECVDW